MTLISGGYIIDGSGSPSFIGDLLFENEIILEIKKNGARTEKNHAIENSEEREIINAEGKIICPGFIDAHRHCDTAVFREGFGDLELKQGITTCVAGNCGMAPAPNTPETREQYENFLMPCLGPFPREKFSSHSEYVRLLQSAKLPLNIGFFAGMGALRVTAKGFDSSPYTKDEMKKARALLAEASFNGAFGLSIGLMYIPEFYSDADEIACLAKEIRGRGIIAAHMRHETNLLVSAVEEVIIIAKKAGIPLHISHFKAAGRGTWGRTLVRAIELIEKERAGGTDITVDFYPYDCGSSTLTQMIPPSYMSRGFEKAIAGLDKPDNIKWIRALLENGEDETARGWDNLSKTIGWDRTVISSAALTENQKYIGKTISEATAESGAEDEIAFTAKLLFSENGKIGIINRSMSQDDIDAIARLSYSSLISDSLYGDMKTPHPRLTGAFPRFLRDFAVKRKVLTTEECIRKMTSAPAARLGIKDKGLLSPGMRADILVFDPDKFRDESDYANPMKNASGLSLCFIGGKKALEEGQVLLHNAGRFEKRQ